VHISEPKHIHARRMQVAWNDDGSRHDAGSFNAEFQRMHAAQDLAREVFGVGPEITFKSVSPMQDLKLIVESLTEGEDATASDLIDAIHLRARI
jgi:hypothetical protein